MNKIIIVVDLGHFKAYRISQAPLESAQTKLIEGYDTIEGHGRLGEKLSDDAGRFGMSGGKNGSPRGYGEPHNIEIENEKRLVKLISKDINTLIKREKCDKWHLAAANNIHKKILDNLEPSVRSRLDKVVTSDLTKVDKSKIPGYFA